MRRSLISLALVVAALVAVPGGYAASPDLMQNGSFEGSLAGWSAFGGSATLATDGVVGSYAVKLTSTSTPYGLFQDGWPVQNATAGDTYTATIWFRSDAPGAPVCLRIREWTSGGGSIVGYQEICPATTAAWAQTTVSYRVAKTGDWLEAYFRASSGKTFEADGITLVNNGGGTPTTTTTTTTTTTPTTSTTTTTTPAPAPETTITSGPPASTTDTSASFAFSSNISGATFQCGLDGAAFAACASPKAYSGLAVGSHTFQVRAVDAAGTVDPTPASQTWQVQAPATTTTTTTTPTTASPPSSTPGDTIKNGSFEGSLTGWTAFGGSATLASDGTVGPGAAKVTSTTSRFGIYTDYWPVQNAKTGDTYTSTAWFRSDKPGYPVCLRIREWTSTGSTVVAYRESCPTSTSTWAQATVSYTVKTSGDLLEAYVFETGASSGASFEADGITLALASTAPAPAPSPTPSPSGDPQLVAAGDIASCTSTWDSATAALLSNWPNATVAALGDNAYENGSAADYANCYGPTWGTALARTRPTPGNHDYYTKNASGYFGYYGSASGSAGKGWYSYDLGTWHIIVLNSNCGAVSCDRGSPQEQWLKADLQAHPNTCTLAYFHHPRFTSGWVGGSPGVGPFWDDLYAYGADVIINGHAHVYERMAPQTPAGVRDPARGIREFVVGTGGEDLHGWGTFDPNDEVIDDNTFGVLALTLHPSSYDWQFTPVQGQLFKDSGTASCH